MLSEARCRLAGERARVAPGRGSTSIGMARMMRSQLPQRGSWRRLSAPISQTNFGAGKRRFSAPSCRQCSECRGAARYRWR